MSNQPKTSDCGATYDHAPHLYRTPRGKIKACDGSVTKDRNLKES